MKNLNLGIFEIVHPEKNYSKLGELLKDYKIPQNGVRICDHEEIKYLRKEFKRLKIWRNLEPYLIKIYQNLKIFYQKPDGSSIKLVVDEDNEILNFINGEWTSGFDEMGNEYDFKKNDLSVITYDLEVSNFFLIKPL